MKPKYFLGFWIAFWLMTVAAFGQTPIVLNDPTTKPVETKLGADDNALIDKVVLPKITKKFTSEACAVEIETAGVIHGAFSRPKSKQTLIFYQICQTGNGLGIVGIVLIENRRVIGNFASEGGWSNGAKVFPDINQNGLDEFALAYSGGIHQGEGGTGVDIMEFAGGSVKGIGWFEAESFTESDVETGYGYKVTAKPGKAPVYFRQKYISASEDKWKRSGSNARFTLGKTIGKFAPVK